MGPHQLQFLSTLVIIVAAAVIALFCDILMRNNAELREMALGLKRSRPEQPGMQPEIVTAAKQRSATGNVSKHAPNPEVLAAIERGIARAAAPPPTAKSRSVRPPAAKPIAARKDWGSLLARNAPAAKIDPVYVRLPAGFQEKDVLRKLIESRLPVNGLVVSISVSALHNSAGAPPESVLRQLQSLLHSMIGPDDFAAARREHEFVLIYPQQKGESAKPRLSLIAQQLWDFQLASIGSLQIMLNWGAAEASGEPIEEAIAKAVENMEENRRGRQLATMAQAV